MKYTRGEALEREVQVEDDIQVTGLSDEQYGSGVHSDLEGRRENGERPGAQFSSC